MKKEEIEDKKYSRKIVISLVVIIVLVFSVISLSFTAYVKMEQTKDANEDIQSNVSMTYTENTNGISIQNAAPISDEAGKILSNPQEFFDFTVTTKVVQDTPVTYEISAVKDSSSTIDDKDIKIYLEKQKSGSYEQVMEPKTFIPIKEKTIVGSPIGSMVLQKVKKETSGTDNYRLRIWINKDADIQESKTYTIRVNVYGKIV